MEALWYGIVAAMLAVYAVLDGYDFGAGILHFFVARTDAQRREVLASIGPFWDGNEVWLVSAGGVLFFSFPKAYAAAFSGFYLPLTLVLWLLLGRGLSLEWRSHVHNPLWRAFSDVVFSASSLLLATVFGAALGNLLRGVPLGPDGYFTIPLFASFFGSPDVGVLDAYTLLVAAFATAALAGHGAAWLALKTGGEVQARARRLSLRLWLAAVVLLVAVTLATARVRPGFFAQLFGRVWAWPFTLGLIAGLGLLFHSLISRRDGRAFAGSALTLAGLLASTAAALFPTLLRSTVDPAYSLDAHNAAAGARGLSIGLAWICVGLPLAVVYGLFLLRSFAGKAGADPHGY